MKTSTPMESEWEGTKEKEARIILVLDFGGGRCYKLTKPETREEGEANARLFTDALHTMQEYVMMSSELRESFEKMKQVRAFWQDAHRKESLYNSKLREENAKLKREIEEMKNKSLSKLDKLEEQTGGRSLAEVLESEEKLKSQLIKNPDLEHFDKIRIKELAWRLDREVWAHVPNPLEPEDKNAWTQSKARERTMELLKEYFL